MTLSKIILNRMTLGKSFNPFQKANVTSITGAATFNRMTIASYFKMTHRRSTLDKYLNCFERVYWHKKTAASTFNRMTFARIITK